MMDRLPSFLASEFEPVAAERARFHVIPAGLEASVSYGGGTADGPRAILEASQQLEKCDGRAEPGAAGIYTAEPVDCTQPVEDVLAGIESKVSNALDVGACPILLGGEHTVSLGAFRALAARGERVGIVQFDAHGDLRDTYEGTPLSHACVMRRAVELGFPICQVGVRSLSPEDWACRQATGGSITYLDARELHRSGVPALSFPADFPDAVYVTFDVDAFDPSLMPATGTPEPGGLFWHTALDVIERALDGRRLIGADLVELAPIAGLHHPDVTAARMVYALMAYAGSA